MYRMYRVIELSQGGKQIKTDALWSSLAMYRMYRAIELYQGGKEIKTDALGSP